MRPLVIYHICRYDHGSVTMLEGFTGRNAEETYNKADDRLDYWWNKFPNAHIDIERKA